MRNSNAPRVVVPRRHELRARAVRLVRTRDSGWESARRRWAAFASDPRFGAALVVGSTFVLLGALLATVLNAVEAPRPAVGYVLGLGVG